MQGIKLLVQGKYACFTEPWSKAERKSYDVITPSSAKGIIKAIYWKPAIEWFIDRIHVLEPIKFINIRRNEVYGKLNPNKPKSIDISDPTNRAQRAMMALCNVRYGIEAHFEMTGIASEKGDETPAKHISVFNRRASKGQHFYQPSLGLREFPAHCILVNEVSDFGASNLTEKDKDFGWMLYDIDYVNNNNPITYRAIMKDGVIDVNACLKGSAS